MIVITDAGLHPHCFYAGLIHIYELWAFDISKLIQENTDGLQDAPVVPLFGQPTIPEFRNVREIDGQFLSKC
jgi:hypothetical protein